MHPDKWDTEWHESIHKKNILVSCENFHNNFGYECGEKVFLTNFPMLHKNVSLPSVECIQPLYILHSVEENIETMCYLFVANESGILEMKPWT